VVISFIYLMVRVPGKKKVSYIECKLVRMPTLPIIPRSGTCTSISGRVVFRL